MGSYQVLKFNGEKIRNLRHLVQMVMSCESEYMRFDLDYDAVVVISSEAAHASTTDVLMENAIPDIASADILDILQK